MQSTVLEGNLLRLPEKIAKRLRGKRIQIREREGGILLESAGNPVAEAKGFLKGKGYTSSEYQEMKKKEKELEA